MDAADCLSEEQLASFASGDGSSVDAEFINTHLQECSLCRQRLDAHKFEPDFLANVRAAAREESQDDDIPLSTDSVDEEATQNQTNFPEIPGYLIRREVGRGGMGVVFEAIQTKLNRSVALKVLPPMMAKISTTAVKRFRAEASAAARLHHNNIVPIYDFGESEGAYYYAMELIEGEPLHKVIQSLESGDPLAALPTQLTEFLPGQMTSRDELSAKSDENESVAHLDGDGSSASSSSATSRAYYRQVARWMRDVADALHHAHCKGIIHRDIKPANLILASDGRIMVADFGLAKCADTESVTMTGSLVGTWRYMSPEQALAKRMPVDHRTDIYSLAATMYELLTFQPAFPGSDEQEIISKLITQEPIRPRKIIRSVPAELETICLKAMEKSRDARYDTAAAFADEFRRFLNDLPIVAKPPGPIVRVRKFAKRHKGGVSMLVALALFLASLGGWIYILNFKNNKINMALERGGEVVKQADELGNEYASLARWRDAERAFNEALELDPKNIKAIGNLARVKKELYNKMEVKNPLLLKQALSLCDEALELDTKKEYYGSVLNVKGVVLKMLNRYPEAIEIYKFARDFDKMNFAVVVNLGTMYVLKGSLEDANRTFSDAERMLSDPSIYSDEGYAFLHLNIGALHLYQSKPTAKEHLTLAHVFLHGHVPTLTLLARSCLELGGCGDQHNARYFAQLADYYAEQQNELSRKAKRILALAYLQEGEYDLAIYDASSANKLDDLPTVNHLIIALAYANLGDRQAAETHLDEALNNWPGTLKDPGDYTVDAPGGFLWFESADQLFKLKAEVEAILSATGR